MFGNLSVFHTEHVELELRSCLPSGWRSTLAIDENDNVVVPHDANDFTLIIWRKRLGESLRKTSIKAFAPDDISAECWIWPGTQKPWRGASTLRPIKTVVSKSRTISLFRAVNASSALAAVADAKQKNSKQQAWNPAWHYHFRVSLFGLWQFLYCALSRMYDAIMSAHEIVIGMSMLSL